jgi:hypothetical protein
MFTRRRQRLSQFDQATDDRIRAIGDGHECASEQDAQPFAEQYCKDRGKAVRFRGIVKQAYYHVASNTALFDRVNASQLGRSP